MDFHNTIRAGLNALTATGDLRRIPSHNCGTLVNLSSNDYLGLASDESLSDEFLSSLPPSAFRFSSSSSRLLSGNCAEAEELEKTLATAYGGAVSRESGGAVSPKPPLASLVFGSGYHANAGIIPALAAADKSTEFFADKLSHASIIDGLRLSGAKFARYRHNNLDDLARLLAESNAKTKIIITESIFSMDGDVTDLRRFVALKRATPGTLIYLDEAHAVGVRGGGGLGLAEETGTLTDIDILVGTFGKALASTGAFAVCAPHIREWLVNKARTLIYTTALPPLNLRWTDFILGKLATPDFRARRERLRVISERVRATLAAAGHPCASASHIIPVMCGTSAAATAYSEHLASHGFRAPPIRPPTVPDGAARVRLSLNSALTDNECAKLERACDYRR
ncbi:MAG: aminotransferase class I/II-fold pyridoxal phosphate-dependent enzyme [Kiritimatiellaeota bacterium]|nr:aminotransferase class I/II-fold pyridoxal phosphate-dependent enzyme [Kiritimatiellota bacterium]